MNRSPKKQIDVFLVELGFAPTREKAQALILSGAVTYKGRKIKSGDKISDPSHLSIIAIKPKYVSRAGEKLEYAIRTFDIRVEGSVALDIGCSTGGFTDCLIQNGSQCVFAIDVGYGQFDYTLKKSSKVVLFEKCNARFLKPSDLSPLDPRSNEINLCTMDVSFISIRPIIEHLKQHFQINSWVLLFKPQFEVSKRWVLKGGRVKNEEIIQTSLKDFMEFMARLGITLKGGPLPSPVAGKKSGNVEYLFYYEAPS